MPNTWDGRDAAEATLVWTAGTLRAAARDGFSTIFDASTIQLGCVMFVLADSEGDFGPGDEFTTGAFGVDTKVNVVGVQGPFASVPFDSGGKKVLVVQGFDASGALAKVDFSIKVTRSVPEQGAGLVLLPSGPSVPFPVPPTLSTPPDQVLWKGGGGGDVTTWNDVLTALNAIKTNLLCEVNSSGSPCVVPPAPPASSACQGRLYFSVPRYLAGGGGQQITVDPLAGPIDNVAGLIGPVVMQVSPGTVGVPALRFTPGPQTPILRLSEGGQLVNAGAQPAILMVAGDQLIIGCEKGGSITASGAAVVHVAAGATLNLQSILGGGFNGAAITGDVGSILEVFTDGTVDFSGIAAQLPGFLGTINVQPLVGASYTKVQAAGGPGGLIQNPPAGWNYYDKTKGVPQWWDGPQGGPGEFARAGVNLTFYAATKSAAAGQEYVPPGSALTTVPVLGPDVGPGAIVGETSWVSRLTYRYKGTGNAGDAGTSVTIGFTDNGVIHPGTSVTVPNASLDAEGFVDFGKQALGAGGSPNVARVYVDTSAPLVGTLSDIYAAVS